MIVPSSGRPYSVPNGAGNGVCGTGGQAGWNGITPGFPNLWYDASFTQAALNPGGAFTDQLAQLQINYGTDEAEAGAGFDFDQVTITNFLSQVPDAQSDNCSRDVRRPRRALAVDARRQRRPGGRARTAIVTPDVEQHRNRGGGVRRARPRTSPGPGARRTTSRTRPPPTARSWDSRGVRACSTASREITAATRPSTHWDATVTETLGELLQQGVPLATKDWTLHVGGSFTDVPADSLFYPAIETSFTTA